MSVGTAEIQARYGVSRRTVANWVGNGCPHQTDGKGHAFDVAKVDEWLANEVRGGKKYLARVKPSKPAKVSAVPVPESIPTEASAEQLLDVMARLQSAETQAHRTWQAAVTNVQKALRKGEDPPFSPAAMEQLRSSWNAIVESRRKWEKDLPTILTEKSRYVDTQLVAAELAKAGTAMASALEGIGIKVAGAVAAAAAGGEIAERKIREIVDSAVRDAQANLARALESLCQS